MKKGNSNIVNNQKISASRSSPLLKHFIRQTDEVIIKEKNNSKAPVINAPKMLVAANVIASRITDVSIVPKIPASNKESGVLPHRHKVEQRLEKALNSNIARYTTAIPKRTHKNSGVTSMTAVIVRRVVTIPMIILAITEKREQVNPRSEVQLQQSFDIFSPPVTLYVKKV